MSQTGDESAIGPTRQEEGGLEGAVGAASLEGVLPPKTEDQGGASGGAWGVAMLFLLVGAFMSILDSSIVNVAIPTLESAFSATTADIQWVITIYLLVLGVAVPASGWLTDRFGPKHLYVASLAVFTIGSFLSGLAWSTGSLIAFRAFQAIGGGMIMPVTMSMVYQLVPRSRIGTAMGIFGVALILAPAIGPTLGGYLVQYVDWRFIFYINVPIGIFGFFGSLAYLPSMRTRPAGRFDLAGFIASAVGLFALLLALSEGATWGWTSEGVILFFYTAFASLVLFVWIELTTKDPLLDLKVFRYTQFTLSLAVMAVVMVALYSGIFYVPLFLQEVVGLGAFQTGLILLPASLVTAVLMPVSGRLYDRIGPAPLSVVGLTVMAVTTYFFHQLSPMTPTGTVVLWMSLRAIGMAFAMMPVTTSGMTWIPTQDVARASAVNNIVQRLSASFGLAVLTSLVTGWESSRVAGYVAAFNPGNALALHFYQSLVTLLRSTSQAVTLVLGLANRNAFVSAIDDLFVVAAAIVVVGIVPSFFLRTNRAPGEHVVEGRMGGSLE